MAIRRRDSRHPRFRDEDDLFLMNELWVVAPSRNEELTVIDQRPISELGEGNFSTRRPKYRLRHLKVAGMEGKPCDGHYHPEPKTGMQA